MRASFIDQWKVKAMQQESVESEGGRSGQRMRSCSESMSPIGVTWQTLKLRLQQREIRSLQEEN